MTWDVIDRQIGYRRCILNKFRILRKLAKKVDKKFNDYYQHVYQITNIIRGAPILTLSEAQKQKLSEMFDIIIAGWEKYKTDDR